MTYVWHFFCGAVISQKLVAIIINCAKMALKNLYFRGVYMKTEWLEWLILYKKYNSLQKVSDICHVTPQNIKKMFNHLEDEMGVTLFEKKGKVLKLTDACQELVEVAEQTLNSIEQIKDKYSGQQNSVSGELKVMSTSSQIILDVLHTFLQRYPDVKFSYMDTTFEEALKSVKGNQDIIAFIPVWQNESFYKLLKKYESHCNIHMLYRDEQRVFVSKHSDFSSRKVITLKELQNKKIVSYSKSGNPDEAKMVFDYVIKKDASFELNITGTNSMQYFQTVVKNDFAVGMGLYSNFKYLEAEDGICSVAIKDESLSACVWCLVYNVNKKITPTDKAFINILTQHCQQLNK